MRLALLVTPAALMFATIGCGQEIVVSECDAHEEPSRDTGPRDTGAPNDASDGGVDDLGMGDIGFGDGGPPTDTGPNGCTGSPYCITDVTVSSAETAVRAPVMLTPTIDNPQAMALTYRAELVGGTRRPEFPPFALNGPGFMSTINVNTTNGEATFVVNDVPSYFTTTTFQVRLFIKGPGAMPEVGFTADVKIKGNVLFTGSGDVFALASDGRPARSVNFTDGRLIATDSFSREPRELLLARDGTLIVRDDGQTPNRLRRFALDSENSLLGDFAFQDTNGVAYLDSTEISRGLVQLPDGKFAAIDYSFSRTISSKIIVWNEDGSYFKTITPLNDVYWNGLAFTDSGDLVTIEHQTNGNLVRIDVASGLVAPVPLASAIDSGWTVTRGRDGYFYIGLTSAVIRVSPTGARQMVNGIQAGTSDYYQYLTPFGPTQMLVTRDYFSTGQNVGLIDGNMFSGWFRPMGIPAPGITPYGLAYLD
jgi:hypothetical protein